MGYFANGSEGEGFQENFCDRCIHDNEKKGLYCPIWNLHLRDNYKECNNEQSYLHSLIRRDGAINRCAMFIDRGKLSRMQIEQIEHYLSPNRDYETLAYTKKVRIVFPSTTEHGNDQDHRNRKRQPGFQGSHPGARRQVRRDLLHRLLLEIHQEGRFRTGSPQ